MQFKKYTWLLLAGLASSHFTLHAQQSAWPEVRKETRPWTRWWWMGSAVDESNIASLLGTYQKAGFGGVEIAPIYGASGYESRYVKYLSPEWMRLLNYTVEKAKEQNMGVDLTNGTGWPFGGPTVSLQDAAQRDIHVVHVDLRSRLRELHRLVVDVHVDVRGDLVPAAAEVHRAARLFLALGLAGILVLLGRIRRARAQQQGIGPVAGPH